MIDLNQAWYEYEEALKRFNAAEADFEKAIWNLRSARQMIEAIPSWSGRHVPSPFPLDSTAQTKPWPEHPTGDKAENYPYCGKGGNMKARIRIFCEQCDRELTHVRYMSDVNVDTADTPEDVQIKINKVILAHRGDCPYWGGPDNREPVNV